MTAGLLLNAGTIAGLWGTLWLLWDKRASAPGYLLFVGLAALVAGIWMS
jgi:hypothetical protein